MGPQRKSLKMFHARVTGMLAMLLLPTSWNVYALFETIVAN